MSEPLVAPQSEGEVRKLARDGGIEFLFAQFVDMHGKPNAKLVPAHHLDDLLTDGAGFAGLRRRATSARARTTPTSSRCPTCAATRRCRGSRAWRASRVT